MGWGRINIGEALLPVAIRHRPDFTFCPSILTLRLPGTWIDVTYKCASHPLAELCGCFHHNKTKATSGSSTIARVMSNAFTHTMLLKKLQRGSKFCKPK
jgi:hypothetical protein